jgi:PAS domain S-box-containing protein
MSFAGGKSPVRILVLEDDFKDRQLIVALLEEDGFDCQCQFCDSGETFEAALQEGNIDLILSDYSLPSYDGHAALACRQVRAPDVPFIILSGKVGEEHAIDSLKNGATDYILKQRPERLPSAVRRALEEAKERRSRTQVEAKIREQATLLDLAQDAIIVCDLENHIRFWNQGAQHLYGWNSSDVLGRKRQELLEEEPESLKAAFECLEVERGWKGELRQKGRDKGEVTVSSRWTLLQDIAGISKTILIINTDITEKKKLEKQFHRAQRLECIGQLASGVAHDLNNILAPILISVPMLRWGLNESEFEKTLTTLEHCAQRGADIVKQLLTFGRGVEGNRIILQLKHLLVETGKMAQETFPRNITVDCKTDRKLWSIKGDPTQLHQVLMNLCVNARDAMPEGGKLSISAENVTLDGSQVAKKPEARPGAYLRLRIQDTGQGIPSEIIDRIFEPFFTTKGEDRGTGLGLSTVLGIVKSHQGFMDVSSEPEQGTAFDIYLPALPDEASPADPSSLKSAPPKGRGETILVVDDEEPILDLWKWVLETNGYRILTATDGVDALTHYAQRGDRIDLVLTDVMMPYMGGVDLIRALKRINPAVRVIASTGMAGDSTEQTFVGELQEMGVTRLLWKPYKEDEMLWELHEFLHAERRAGPPAGPEQLPAPDFRLASRETPARGAPPEPLLP